MKTIEELSKHQEEDIEGLLQYAKHACKQKNSKVSWKMINGVISRKSEKKGKI